MSLFSTKVFDATKSASKIYRTGFTADQLPDLSDKVAIVTGGNTGMGYEYCLELARHGAHVIMASRSEDRAANAIAAIKKSLGDAAKIEFLKLDLMDLKQIKAAADKFMKMNLPLHILINNAGTIQKLIL